MSVCISAAKFYGNCRLHRDSTEKLQIPIRVSRLGQVRTIDTSLRKLDDIDQFSRFLRDLDELKLCRAFGFVPRDFE